MDFEQRLEKAIQRGQRSRTAADRQKSEQTESVEDLRSRHTSCRLELSDHIETCLRRLADHFLGFDYQSVVGEEGWGAKISRDDLSPTRRRGVQSLYSRLEMYIRPFSDAHIVELTAKGTIRNKEILSRNHFQFLSEVDLDSYRELIDLWVLEYAEKYAATE